MAILVASERLANPVAAEEVVPDSSTVQPLNPRVKEEETEEEEEEEEPLVECSHCSNEWDADDMFSLDGRHVCPDCYTTCDMCNDGTLKDHTVYIGGYGDVCQSCREDYFTGCSACGDLEHNDHIRHSSEDDNYYCRPCYADTLRSRSAIAGYHSSNGCLRRHPSPWTMAHGNRYFGVELEVESRNGDDEQAEAVALALQEWEEATRNTLTAEPYSHGPLFRMEEDGSLSCGFEIITVPMGLDDHRTFWPALLQRSHIRGLSSHNSGSCGLHVHVSRASLSNTQIARMVCFVNEPNNKALIQAIARRYANGYNKFKNKTLDTCLHDDEDRYEAVNLVNRDTIEFRIFRGTLRPDAVVAAIEFTHAVVEYCDDKHKRGADLSSASFLKFVCSPDMEHETATLRSYLESRGVSLPSLATV